MVMRAAAECEGDGKGLGGREEEGEGEEVLECFFARSVRGVEVSREDGGREEREVGDENGGCEEREGCD